MAHEKGNGAADEPRRERSPADLTRDAAHCDLPASGEVEAPPRKLTPEAQRALAEAEERRKTAAEAALPKELGGRDGPEPVRYGDWEKKGIAVDF